MTNYTPRDLRDAWVDYRTGDESFDEYKDYTAANAAFEQIMSQHDGEVNARLATLIEDIKKIHRPIDVDIRECTEDVENWPCPTMKAVWKAES